MYSPKLLSAFANLTEVIKQGGTALPHGGVMEPELDEWVTFAESMTPIMSPAAELIAELAISMGGVRSEWLTLRQAWTFRHPSCQTCN